MINRTIPFPASIKWIRKETRDTFTIGLKIKDRSVERFYSFRPGQFNMLYVAGTGEAPISISSAPDDHELTHTIRIAGDVTTVLSRLQRGDVIGVRGPFGNGWPVEELVERDIMIIAGGLGIAPLRSLIRYIMKSGSCSGGKKFILYGSKTPKDIIFRDEFPRYKNIFDVYLTVDKADPEEHWPFYTGLITNLIDKIKFDPINTTVFMCGPEIMMQNMVRELLLKSVPGEKIYISMERNMNCGMGICGHCMFGPFYVCRDGPVFRFSEIENFMGVREI